METRCFLTRRCRSNCAHEPTTSTLLQTPLEEGTVIEPVPIEDEGVDVVVGSGSDFLCHHFNTLYHSFIPVHQIIRISA